MTSTDSSPIVLQAMDLYAESQRPKAENRSPTNVSRPVPVQIAANGRRSNRR